MISVPQSIPIHPKQVMAEMRGWGEGEGQREGEREGKREAGRGEGGRERGREREGRRKRERGDAQKVERVGGGEYGCSMFLILNMVVF